MGRSRISLRHLDELLTTSNDPVYVLDDRRKIVYCNRACCLWLGVANDQLLGQRCDYASGEQGEELLTSLCPPPDAFLGHSMTGRIVGVLGDDETAERTAHFLPLGSGVQCAGVIVVVSNEPVPCNDDVAQLDSPELHRQLQLLTRAHRSCYRLERLVGESPAMRHVRAQISLAIQTGAGVLVQGPAGSGREHVARTIHYATDASDDATLAPLDCPLLDKEALLATVEGFLDYVSQLETPRSPALLLLDADQLPADGQAELLRFLDHASHLRTLATCRHSLLSLADDGRFDTDLAYRLSTLMIDLPPLASRREDVPYLAQQLLEMWNAGGDKQMSGFVPEVLDQLGALPWHRNVDELAEVIHAACENASGVWINSSDLPERVRMSISAAAHPPPSHESIELEKFLEDVERELIWRALKRAKGNKSQAARLLGITRPRLLRRVAALGLDE
jgi:DNA-binding NtrC family response regulator